MPIDFPNSPSNNQVYTLGNRSWVYSTTTSSWTLQSSAVLGANTVTATEIADGSITTSKIAAGAVIESDIADDAVTGSKIAADTITPDNLHTSVQLGYRNVIINGAMQVAQRGTSTTGITSGALYYTADRMMFYVNSAGTWTTDIQNDAPTGSGFRKSFRALCTTADASLSASDELIFIHRIEGQNLQQFLKGTSSAKQFTLSFWVKSNATGTYNVEFRDEDNARHIVGSYTINASGTWEKKTITVAGDTTAAFDNDNGMSLQMQFWLAAGSNYTSGTRPSAWASSTNANRAVGQTNLAAATNNYWQITGVQLEAGAVATPFEFEDYGTTLRKCQRYFCKTYALDTTLNTNTQAGALLAGKAYTTATDVYTASWRYPVQMRAAPTVTLHNTSGSGTATWFDASAGSISAVAANISDSGAMITNNANATAGLTGVIHASAAIEL